MHTGYSSRLSRWRWPNLLALLLLVAVGAYAASGPASPKSGASLDYLAMGIGLFGGLALFLYGMDKMAEALKLLAGEGMKDLLARLTTNRFTSVLTGALVTAVIQSSSVTTVLTVSFVTAGILSLTQAVGIIFGANIGTTLTAQIIAFKITAYALLMVAVGFGMNFIGKGDKLRQYGAMIMGLGLIFLGMDMMSEAMKPLRSYGPFLELLTRMENPLLGIAVAAVFTALVQSSSATTGIVIVMASQGLITLPAGIALILGANIGTCITALLASFGKPLEARRTAAVHILFNVLGVLIWVGLVEALARIVVGMSPVAEGLSGIDKLAAETPRQVANAHTVFNVVNTLLFLPFTAYFARLAVYLVREKPQAPVTAPQLAARHLDPSLLQVPPLALEQVRLELSNMAEVIGGMLRDFIPAFQGGDRQQAEDILLREDIVDQLDAQITEYLTQIAHASLTLEHSAEQVRLLHISNELEHIGDVLEKHLVPLAVKKAEEGIQLSADGQKELEDLQQRVLGYFGQTAAALGGRDLEAAARVAASAQELEELAVAYRKAHYSRFTGALRDVADRNQLYMDALDYWLRIHAYAVSIARAQLPEGAV